MTELDNLLNDIENGRKRYKRYGEIVLWGQPNGFTRSGRANEASSIILGRNACRNGKEYGDKGVKRKESPIKRSQRRQQEGKQQEQIIEAWAKENGLWLNNYKDPSGKTADSLESLIESQWDYLSQGSESKVYRYDENTVLKSINLSHYDGNLLMALDKFVLHNILSPNAPLEVVGFGRDSLGLFQIIALQPYIQGEELTDEEFNDFVQKQKIKELNGWYNLGKYKVTDIAPYNVKKYFNKESKQYEFFVIDADLRLMENEFEIDNGIEEI